MFDRIEFAKRFISHPLNRKHIKIIGKYCNEDAYRVRVFDKEIKATGEELRKLGVM